MYSFVSSLFPLAPLQGQLDSARAEVSRLKREYERVEEERDRAREEARK